MYLQQTIEMRRYNIFLSCWYERCDTSVWNVCSVPNEEEANKGDENGLCPGVLILQLLKYV